MTDAARENLLDNARFPRDLPGAPRSGSGLGLAQVCEFVKQSGGDVRLTSEEGIGTTVHVYLPRCVEVEMRSTKAEKPVNPAPVNPGRATTPGAVMVVDDDAEVQAVLVEMVQGFGYQVSDESDARKALDRIKAGERVDLVLTDYHMPNGMSGLDLAREIAAIDSSIKLLLISGNLPADHRNDCEIPILQKPISIAVLEQAIRRALSSRMGA